MKTIELNLDELEHGFEFPGDPRTGIDEENLEKGLIALLEKEKACSHTVIKAKAFAYILDNMRLDVSPHDLFVTFGIWGRKPFQKTIFPVWADDLFENTLRRGLSFREEIKKNGVAFFCPDFSHSVPDWDTILALGFKGLRERAVKAEETFLSRIDHIVTAENRDFFLSVRIEYDAVERLMNRLCSYAENSDCHPETKKALRHLRNGAATTLYEAILQIWLYYQLSEYADLIETRSFGNLDRMLYPYYLNDLTNRTFTEEDIRIIFRNFFYKVTAMHYYYGHPFYFGGTNPDGTSEINELSYLILDEYGKAGVYDPKLQIKVANNTPHDFLDKALNLIRSGRNSIVFVGEPCISKTMLAAGYSAEEGRTAEIKGCYEYTVRGKAVETVPVRLNLPLLLLKTMRAGTEYQTFDALEKAYFRSIEEYCDVLIKIANEFEPYLADINPAPLFSGTSLTSLERGVDGYAKGSVYNNSNLWLMGPATAGNSLAMIRKYVFELKQVTLSEFQNALDADWQGYEELQLQILNDLDKFGNGRKVPDEITRDLVETVAKRVNGRRNGRGGFFTTALHSADFFLIWGKITPATPDGRRGGEECSKNISATPGTTRNGVTALIRSVLTLDPSHFMGDFPLDVMLHPSAVSGDDGLVAMRSLMLAYILHGGHAIHFNIFSLEELRKAQMHPEKYQDLQVRVCGWNVLWNNLSTKEQNSYLRQAEVIEESL